MENSSNKPFNMLVIPSTTEKSAWEPSPDLAIDLRALGIQGRDIAVERAQRNAELLALRHSPGGDTGATLE